MSAAMELHVALSRRLDAIEAYRLAHAYRAEVITAVAEEAERRLQVGASGTVTKDAVLRFLRLQASVARAAKGKSTAKSGDATPDSFEPGHLYALDVWRFHCATVTPHPRTGEPQAIGWLQVSDGSWTTYAYSAAEWGRSWTDITDITQGDSK